MFVAIHSCSPFWDEAERSDVIVWNRGAHVLPLETTLRQTAALASRLAAEGPLRTKLHVWRTTAVGHWPCGFLSPGPAAPIPANRTNATRPLPFYLDAWRQIPGQSERILSILRERKVALRVLDAAGILAQRRDLHGSPPFADCLHYCIPGPWDWVARVLTKMVADVPARL